MYDLEKRVLMFSKELLKYIKSIYISSTMSYGLQIDPKTIDE